MKKAEKNATSSLVPMLVIGLDENGKPRGARFSESRDDIAEAAKNLKCQVVTPIPADLESFAKQLPAGRVYASGKAFIPNIRRDLYEKIASVAGKARNPSGQAPASPAESSQAENVPPPPCVSPITSGLPRSWENVGTGHMVLIQESLEDGWWEAVVVSRENELLTLRYRDYPKAPQFVRHINTVALVNPGPA